MKTVYDPITKELMDKWITALRSGDYARGTGRLENKRVKDTTTYCCLGVLGKIAEHEKLGDRGFLYDKEPEETIGCTQHRFLTKQRQHTLAELNDNGVVFTQIANYLEERKTEIIEEAAKCAQ